MIIIYLAIAGACAEDKANAGGGGTPPAGVTLNRVYFSDSSTSGANAGAIVKIYRNRFIFGIGSGIGTDITGLTQNVAVSALSQTQTKSTYTLPATNLSSFFSSAASAGENVFLNLAAFIQAPNGLNSLTKIEVVSVATTSSGLFVFNEAVTFGTTTNGSSYPLQNSLSIGNDVPIAGFSGNWGIMGTGTISQSFGGLGNVIGITTLIDNTARGGTINTGDTMTIVYSVEGVNSSGVTENAFHTVEITLS